MVSKTNMTALVRAFDAKQVGAAILDSPELLAVRDERGRNWLHLCCSVDIEGDKRAAAASVRTADVLLEHGLDLDAEAFTEDDWKATPLWFAVGRGHNLVLAEHLLKLGCNPNYALWAAAFRDDFAAIKLLVRYGAIVDDPAADETPFVGAVKVSHFESAELLLKLGADVNAVDGKGMTALHYMLKKGSDKQHFRMLVRYGARGDIPDPSGRTAAETLRKKKDPDFAKLAGELSVGKELPTRSRAGVRRP